MQSQRAFVRTDPSDHYRNKVPGPVLGNEENVPTGCDTERDGKDAGSGERWVVVVVLVVYAWSGCHLSVSFLDSRFGKVQAGDETKGTYVTARGRRPVHK